MADLVDGARAYLKRGWTPIALGLDAEGRPKKPIAPAWQQLTPEAEGTRKQGWKRAHGIGVLCGPASGNLAVIDVDDVDLAQAMFAKFVRSNQPFRWVWTIRGRGHLYLKERTPTEPTRFKVFWGQGEERHPLTIELRTAGNQVAAPPTPGYILAQECEPVEVDDVRKAWAAIEAAMGIERVKREDGRDAGYPESWRAEVPAGERNDTLFMEAVRMASAGIPMPDATEFLCNRVQTRYSTGSQPMTQQEIRVTIHSAYRAAWPNDAQATNPRYARSFE